MSGECIEIVPDTVIIQVDAGGGGWLSGYRNDQFRGVQILDGIFDPSIHHFEGAVDDERLESVDRASDAEYLTAKGLGNLEGGDGGVGWNPANSDSSREGWGLKGGVYGNPKRVESRVAVEGCEVGDGVEGGDVDDGVGVFGASEENLGLENLFDDRGLRTRRGGEDGGGGESLVLGSEFFVNVHGQV